jgi:hypothetical protein
MHGCISIGIGDLTVVMQKIMLSVSDEMLRALEGERKARKLETIPEAVRAVLGEYFKGKVT